jgi:hypothetical protein
MTIDQLRHQQAAGFRWLRFQSELESRYRDIRDQGIRERARPVSASALVLFLVYALLDWVMLPDSLARNTVFIRLLITCPTISLMCAPATGAAALWECRATVRAGSCNAREVPAQSCEPTPCGTGI